MNFKDFAAQDIKDVFFNLGEFSDEIMIDGQPIIVQIDDDRLQKRSENEFGGITTGMILYFIPVSSFSQKPKVGGTQIFNGKLMYIDDIKESAGVFEIVLNQNRGE
ncbi:hypothetical protein E0485_21780 [Paenibacillus albiflavus]|uniref:Uncharacterized protein n=1 Tax=Paenibacillus albiflavus TaxID=2545760 RepID=A0A4V2WMV0_9BACL|nr:hypothetical protein [Paenibacillus albiflavus]TCZ73052.1 hypothetical protein E0485_21780 [Paenibacillus albiflavus]